jgi:hypothetical protein
MTTQTQDWAELQHLASIMRSAGVPLELKFQKRKASSVLLKNLSNKITQHYTTILWINEFQATAINRIETHLIIADQMVRYLSLLQRKRLENLELNK